MRDKLTEQVLMNKIKMSWEEISVEKIHTNVLHGRSVLLWKKMAVTLSID